MNAETGAAVLEERDGAVLVLTMNRPDRLNALARPLRDGLRSALERAMGDDEVGAIVLTGAGRAFCAGGDLDELAGADDLGHVLREGFNPLVRLLAESAKPVVAAVNGPAAGAGLGLALACQLRVIADGAFLTVAFAGVGLAPDTGVSWMLPRLVGPAVALELAVTGRRVVAEEALRLGLANRVVDGESVVASACELAAELARGSRSALTETRRLLLESPGKTLDEALEAEAATQSTAGAHPDFAEGVSAFRERRPPRFG